MKNSKLEVKKSTLRNLTEGQLAGVLGGNASGGTSVISVSSGTSVISVSISPGTSINPSGGSRAPSGG